MELLAQLQGMKNVIVVGSNERIDDGFFRHVNGTSDVNESSLWLGNMELVRSYHGAAQTRTLLETGLDADDGLALDFVEEIQKQTTTVAKAQKKLRVESWWKIWCVKQNTEWFYYGKYLNSTYGHMRQNGGLPNVCITPGLTRVSTPDHRTFLKSSASKQRGGEFPLLAAEGYRFFVDHFYIQSRTQKRGTNQVGGWSYIPAKHSLAVRARSPTSAGMKGVERRQFSGRQMAKIEKDHWMQALRTFGLSMQAIKRTRHKIQSNLADVLGDALAGQCSEGHSCKATATEVLSRLRQHASIVV